MAGNTLRYLAVYNDIKADILSSKYPPNSFLPTEEQLMQQYSMSRTTIRRATALLKKENLITVKQGRGAQIQPIDRTINSHSFYKFHNVTDISTRFNVEGEARNITHGAIIDQLPAESKVARALKVKPGTMVYRLQRMNYVDDIVFGYSVNYLRTDLVPGLERHNNKIFNLYQFLEKHYGIYFDHGEESISATAAGFLEARLLNVEVNAPILLFRRIAFTDKEPLEYSEMTACSDLMEIVVTMHGAPSFYRNE